MSEVLYHNQLSNGSLARAVHKAFNFSADDTYRGKRQIEIRRDDNIFSVTARTDEQIREFILESAGKTQFIETWNNHNPYEIGSKITSIVFPDRGVAERQEAAEMAFVRKQAPIEWLDGPKAAEVRRIHKYMVEEVLPLLRDYMTESKIVPDDAPSALQKYRCEEANIGGELKAFLSRRNGPAAP